MLAATYTIRPGDTLTSIAAAHGLPGWQALYFAPCNRSFRQQNPDPDLIFPGRLISIPRDKQEQMQALRMRLTRLRQARADGETLFRDQERELDGAHAEVKKVAQGVDTTATVALLIVSLTKLTMDAHKVMNLSDELGKEAIDKAHKKFRDDFVKDKLKGGRDLAAQVVAQGKSESTNTVWLVTKSVAGAWCDMTSPSFWASTVTNLVEGRSWGDAVTFKPEDRLREAKGNLMATRQKVLAGLDERIREAEQELNALNRPAAPLP